jgi:PEP-CTERM motif
MLFSVEMYKNTSLPIAIVAGFFVCVGPGFCAAIVNNGVVLCDSNNTHCQTLVSQATTLNYSNTLTSGANSITLTGFADENLTTGALKASETYSVPGPQTFYTQANTFAQIQDTFTISSASLNGSLGYLAIPFAVTGTTTPSGQGSITAALFDPAGVNTTSCPTPQTLGCFFQGNISFTTPLLPFHYGTPFNLFWALAAVTYPASSTAGLLTGSADYSHTATITGFEVFDAQQRIVTNATITAPGGEQIALVTPEPGSIALIGTGLVALLLRRRLSYRPTRCRRP